MSSLVRLYPAAWRNRYEEEFLALLEARPPTVGDRFDIVRGAVDARLHPQVREADQPREPFDERAANLAVARRLGFAALAGAASWVATWMVAATAPLAYDGYGSYREQSLAAPLLLLSVVLLIAGLVGHMIRLPPGRPIARIGAVTAMGFSLLWSVGPWNVIVGAIAVVGLVTFALGATRTGDLSRTAAIAVVGGCGAVVLFSILTIALLVSPSGIRDASSDPYQILVIAALTAAPIWLGVGGSLVAGTEPARLRPA
jgi:hypothetical protein